MEMTHKYIVATLLAPCACLHRTIAGAFMGGY